MASQVDISELNIDQEVDDFSSKKKRKMSESQLKALAEGRKKRWSLKADSGLSAITPLDVVEEKSDASSSEEDVKSDQPDDSIEEDQLSSEQSDSDASDISADSYSSFDSAATGDSDKPQEGVNEPKTPPISPTLKRENARDAKDVKNARAAAKMKKYIERQQQLARENAPRHLFL